MLDGRQQLIEGFDGDDVHRRGESIVGALPPVNVVVWQNGQLRLQLLAFIRHHFVDVHIGLGPRPRLVDLERKVLAQGFIIQRQQFINGLDNQLALGGSDLTRGQVGLGRGFLDVEQSPNDC